MRRKTGEQGTREPGIVCRLLGILSFPLSSSSVYDMYRLFYRLSFLWCVSVYLSVSAVFALLSFFSPSLVFVLLGYLPLLSFLFLSCVFVCRVVFLYYLVHLSLLLSPSPPPLTRYNNVTRCISSTFYYFHSPAALLMSLIF